MTSPGAPRVMITGVGLVGPTGLETAPFLQALRERAPLGSYEEIPTLRGRTARVRVARLPAFDREAHLHARALRRMAEVSQIWTIACLRARADAQLDGDSAAAHAPERRGTWLGTGYGCIDATWNYLVPMLKEGCSSASPFLFSESVANAPAGHSAIEMDTRGAAITLTCGDASALVAVSRAAAAIRAGRLDVAWAGGVDLMVPPLLRVLAALRVPFVGEGAVCLVLEEAGAARRRGARVLAEVTGSGLASDPRAMATLWSRDASSYGRTMRRAAGGPVAEVFLHAPADAAARAAEETAAASVCPGAPIARPGDVMGMFGAAGGFGLAAAALTWAGAAGASADPGDRLISGASWGGALGCVRLSPPPAAPAGSRP